MNKMLLGLALTASVVANAQTTSTTAVAPAAQTSTATAAAATPAAAKKFTGAVYLGVATMGSDVDAGNAIGSTNYLEAAYQASPNIKLAVRHNFEYTFEGSNDFDQNYNLVDSELQLKTKLSPIGTSAPVALAFRYYVPVSEGSRISKRTGTLRTDISTEWAMTPKFALGAYLSPRITFQNTGGKTGSGAATTSDDVVRLVASPSATYSFNDAVNVYYAPSLDYATTELAYGKVTARSGYPVDGMKWNTLSHEVGANFQVGKVGINPAIINYTDLSTGEAGYGKAERMEYDINVLATF